jgi:hypothetical protein
MTKLTIAFLSIWASLIMATANRGTVSRLHGEWLKLAVRVAQHPLPFDVTHTLASLDPDGHFLRAVMTMTA